MVEMLVERGAVMEATDEASAMAGVAARWAAPGITDEREVAVAMTRRGVMLLSRAGVCGSDGWGAMPAGKRWRDEAR